MYLNYYIIDKKYLFKKLNIFFIIKNKNMEINDIKKFYIIIFIALLIIIILLISLRIVFNRTPSNSNEDFDIEIIDYKTTKSLSNIKILRTPDKITYKEGEFLDTNGMIVKGFYNDESQLYIEDYKIDKDYPLTIYDTNVIVSYEGKTASFDIQIFDNEGKKIYENPSKEQYTLEPIEGITRFEIEDSDITNWIISNDENKNSKIIKRKDASRGGFICGINENVEYKGKLTFNLVTLKVVFVLLISKTLL